MAHGVRLKDESTGAVISFLRNDNSAERIYTLQNRAGTLADDTDLALLVPKARTIAGIDLVDNITAAELRTGIGTASRVILPGNVVNNDAVANTLADVTGLLFPVVNGGTYYFYCWIAFSSAAGTTGSRWTINGPTNSALVYNSSSSLTASSYSMRAAADTYQLPAAASATSPNTGFNTAYIEGTVTATADGNIQVQFASEVSGSAITALGGLCFIEYIRLN